MDYNDLFNLASNDLSIDEFEYPDCIGFTILQGEEDELISISFSKNSNEVDIRYDKKEAKDLAIIVLLMIIKIMPERVVSIGSYYSFEENFPNILKNEIMDAYSGKGRTIFEIYNDYTDVIADFLFKNTDDYDWFRDFFYWTDGTVGITYLNTNGEIKTYIL